MTRYRLFMAVGCVMLLVGFFARILTGDLTDAATGLMAAIAMGAYAALCSRIPWVTKNHHFAAVLCILPLTLHMSMMTFTSNLSYEMSISNVVILTLVCCVVDKRNWLNLLVTIWCGCLITTAWAVVDPVMSPFTFTNLMVVAAIFIGMVVINFHEAQDLLKRKINELHESQAFARVGTWEVDMRTLTPTWSSATHQILDIPIGDEVPDFGAMLEDSETNKEFSARVQKFFEGEDNYDARGLIVTGSGKPMWIHSRGTTFYEQGKPVRKLGVFSDITQHVEREQALEEAKQVAESAAEARTQFLANMSHEIRTPMNGVIGMTSLLGREALTDDGKYYVEVIQNCSESLLSTINDILDFTKLDAGKVILESRAFKVNKLLSDSVAIVQKSIADKNLAIKIVGDAQELEFMGDPLRLSQVLVNLLSNAIKFTEVGSITLRADRLIVAGEQRLKLQVVDTGIGIDEETQARLFTPFTQADASTTREYGGTGLGLVICDKLIKQMQGTLRMESELGRGTTFSIELTLPVAAPMVDETAAQPPSRIAADLRVLLAEDNKVNQAVATRMLQKLGLTATVVENGVEALEEIKCQPFDLVLMDLQMPQMDGIDATKRIRELKNIEQPKIIALTANAMQEDRDRCIDMGMNAFLSKPIRLEDLRQAIARHF